MRRGVAAVVLVSLGLGACSLIVDATGLSGGAISSADASASDVLVTDAVDATIPVADATADASPDAGQDARTDTGAPPAEACATPGDAGSLVYPGDPCNFAPNGQPIPSQGACKPGTWACVDLGAGNRTATCIGAVGPVPEICTLNNGAAADENCNGTVDEGCGCTLGATRPCGVGQCAAGAVQICVTGDAGAPGWGPCVGPAPKTRDCSSSLDNDCNGTADNAEAFCKCVGPAQVLKPPGTELECSNFGSINACATRKRTCVTSQEKGVAAWDVACQSGVVTKCTSGDQDCSGFADSTERVCNVCRDGAGGQVPINQTFSNGLAGCGGVIKFSSRAALCAPGCAVAREVEWNAGAQNVVVPTAHYWLDEDNLRYFSKVVGPGCVISKTGVLVANYAECADPTLARVCAPNLPNNKDAYENVCTPTCGTSNNLGGCGAAVNDGAGTICKCP